MTTAFKLEAIVKHLPELEELCSKKAAATVAFSDACKAVALNSGMNASTYRAQLLRWRERREQIRTLVAAGIRPSVIARRYQISAARVHQIVNRKGSDAK